MSTYPAFLLDQCNKVILSDSDIPDRCNVIHNVDNTGLNSVSGSASADNAKTECLSLISKIWKAGLNCKLEQFKNNSIPSQHTAVMEAEAGSCKRCLELNGTVFHVTDGSCALQSGIVQSKSSHTKKGDALFQSLEGQSTLLSGSVESTLMNNKLSSSNSSGKMLNNNEELTSVSISFSPSQQSDPSCHDNSKILLPRIGPIIAHQQDGDPSVADIPPFKKARYSWQVKNNKMKGVVSEQADSPVTCNDQNALTNASSSMNVIQQSGEDVIMTAVHQNVVSTEMDTQAGNIKENTDRHLLTSNNNTQDVDMLLETSPELVRTNINSVPPQGAPNHQDFNKLTEALTQLTHTERWQCQHVAKAIVDNAINKTLEEMGLSPGSNGAVYHEQRSRIEDAGVSQAILSRGLRRYTPSTYCMHRLNPLIDRLTNMSENILSDHGGEVLLESSDSPVNSQLVTSEMMDIYFNLEGPLSGQTEANSQEDVPSDVPPPSPGLSSDVETSVSSATMLGGIPAVLQSKQLTTCAEDSPIGEGHCLSEAEYCPIPLLENSNISCKQGTTLEEIEKGPTAKYILDQAVNAVICERGLQCQEFF